ncbi:MAG: hypothetical protein CMD99_07440 [Gammaproteobacteria bacterium]|nr:hypothetical protein [Gammaproteobacteria bacterium]
MKVTSPEPVPLSQSMSGIVRRALEEKIIYGELAPGSRLFEEELVQQFNVSRSPVREALKVMEHDGLVFIEPRRGARVAKLSITDLDEVYATRVVLESLAAAQAAEHCDEDEKERLYEDLKGLENAFATELPREFFKANVVITNSIHEISRNRTLARLLGSIAKQSFRYRYLAYSMVPDLMKISIESNRALVEAIVANESCLARSVMESVLRQSWRRVVVILRSEGRELFKQNPNSVRRQMGLECC